MQETTLEVKALTSAEEKASPSLLDLPVAKLQIVQAHDVVIAPCLDRSLLEPKLMQNADGLWFLTVRRQGEYRKFERSYISSEIVLADAELGLIVVLVSLSWVADRKVWTAGLHDAKGPVLPLLSARGNGRLGRSSVALA